MVVEDDSSIRGLVSLVLKREGYDVIEAINGRDALDKLHLSKPELLLTDIEMPVLDGVELIKQLRNNNEYESLPIIVFSIKSRVSEKKRIENFQINEWIEKPCKLKHLLSVVNNYVS